MPRTSVAVETEDPLRPDYIVESQYRQFEILTIPKVKYFQEELQKEIRVSNSDTIKELLQKIVQSDKFQQITGGKDRKGCELVQLCRIWKFEG